MYRTANIAAFDVMDEVHISAQVTLYDGYGKGEHEVEIRCATTVSGVGSSEGQIWLRDALVALAETL
jgi:hypothetical protein